jgi:hypothetical protein
MINHKLSEDVLIVGRMIMENEKSFYIRYKKTTGLNLKTIRIYTFY